jgi:hypothetical protein
VTISAATLLSNDSDADGDVVSISAVNNAINGTVELDQNGNVIFTPTIGFSVRQHLIIWLFSAFG